MPQNNYLTMFQATYPLLAPTQKPGGVTVATTATAPRVPNKHVYAAGTTQMVEYEHPLARAVVAERLSEKIEEVKAKKEEKDKPTNR